MRFNANYNSDNHGDRSFSENLNVYSINKRKKTSKLRAAIPQILAVIGSSFLFFLTWGMNEGFFDVLRKMMSSPHPDRDLIKYQFLWNAHLQFYLMPILQVLGCIIGGLISNYFGCKISMIFANIPLISSFIIFYFATNVPLMVGARALLFLGDGLCLAPALTYITEITQPHLRGFLSVIVILLKTIGTFSQLIIIQFTKGDWRKMALINSASPIICFLLLLFLPESPHWLTGKKQLANAEKSLRWLRGWTKISYLQEELQLIRQVMKKPVNDKSVTEKNKWRTFGQRQFILPFILIVIVFLFTSFSGTLPFTKYSVDTMGPNSFSIDFYISLLSIGLCAIAVHFIGKRVLSLIFISGTGISCLGLAIFNLLFTYGYMKPSICAQWINIIFSGASLFFNAGFKLLPWIIVSEIFPASIRSIATGVAIALQFVFSKISDDIVIPHMEANLPRYGIFTTFSLINFIGISIIYFLLPETEGRTLKEIEDHYADIQSLNSKPRTKKTDPVAETWIDSNHGIATDDSETEL